MLDGTTLEDEVWALLEDALAVYRDSPRAVAWLRGHQARFAEPVRVAVAGSRRSGKSTVVSALIGEEFAPTGATTWYQDGPQAKAHVGPYEVPVTRRDGKAFVDAPDAERVVVEWPSRSLRDLILIDTPAEAPVEQVYGEADAVLYLTRHMHTTDVRYLQTAHDHPVARAAPVNTVLVLARADEIGGGRIDALSSAKQIARRYRREATVTPLCQNVVAVAGLLAVAARTVRADEFTALSRLAALARTDLDKHLLSADRFVADDFPVRLDPAARRGLVDRFGVFGVRLTTTLIRQGFDTQVKLTGQLVQRSGLGELRDSVGIYFTERRDALKARSALLGLDVVLRAEPRPGSIGLATAVERILASTHDFRELRLLAALQGGRTRLPGDLDAEASRLVGGLGTNPVVRLGMDYEPTEGELRHAVLDTLGRWRDHAVDPALDHAQRRAASVVVRSCEGMLAPLS
ncbi:GTPase domain-containing protein [Saccharothrix sp. NRRL B-16314]|uniref:GTPase domain-containing protein n=1 Tax=Saccharothrix sp. NRRL B-16314 TaxID=1463825 RepID=UPI0005244C17|nr:GTPase domain-containing protein [Saccharothrix sp. NRRL B-16314]